jgi:hypothetical protein
MPAKPHPANVPGDFYVENGCCTLCSVPFTEAAELFGWWPNQESPDHCYVKRQPQNAGELDRMVMAIRVAELQCIHYCGNNRELQTRLVDLGEGLVCDHLPADLQQKAEAMEAEATRRRVSARDRDRSLRARILNWLFKRA